MFIQVTLAGITRDIRPDQLEHYLTYGWTQVEAQPDLFTEPTTVDSGPIVTRSPKKKKSEKTAETAPEAAKEDLDNVINTGESE